VACLGCPRGTGVSVALVYKKGIGRDRPDNVWESR
jgi:hypothetical protein